MIRELDSHQLVAVSGGQSRRRGLSFRNSLITGAAATLSASATRRIAIRVGMSAARGALMGGIVGVAVGVAVAIALEVGTESSDSEDS